MKAQTKVKLIYSGELLIIAIVFLVLGILKLLGVMGYDDGRRVFFNYLTTAGGIWLVIDLVWALMSPKRRKRVCLLDKFLNVPLGIFLLVFDIMCFMEPRKESFYIVMMSFAFMYLAVNYIFQSIYHFFNPIPQLIEEMEKAEENENGEHNPPKEDETNE